MTDAHQQSLYDLLGSVFKAGQEHGFDAGHSAAFVLFPAGQQLVALVEGMLQEEREACATVADVCKDDWAGTAGRVACREIAFAIRARTSPPQPEVPA